MAFPNRMRRWGLLFLPATGIGPGPNRVQAGTRDQPRLRDCTPLAQLVAGKSGPARGERSRDERALELDPISIEINSDLGMVLLLARRPDEAIERFRKALEIDANFPDGHLGLGRAYQQKGNFRESIVELEKAHTLSRDRPDILADLGYSYALAGDKAKALGVIQQLNTISQGKNSSSYHLARVYLALNEKDLALAALEAAHQARSGLVIGLNADPAFDSLHAEPRFQKIVNSIGVAR